MRTSVASGALVAIVLAMAATISLATESVVPKGTTHTTLSPDAAKALDDILRYNTTRGLTALVKRAQENAQIMRSLPEDGSRGPAIKLPTAVEGSRSIPVLTLTFSDTEKTPYSAKRLQQELFDGPSKSGTMTDFYKEISNNKFKVTGTVYDWTQLKAEESYYSGPLRCHGICKEGNGTLGEMITELLDRSNDNVDFSRYDNDGPDGVPNSGDDDGYVDFVAIVQPRLGGECGDDTAIWSHRYSLTNLIGKPYETRSLGKNGQHIIIDDYVIVPAFACDAQTMIQIGVFAHEFGHAFGLPDLYDTHSGKNQSAGVGGWDLMGSGSWGGRGTSPETPSHMSAWSKEFLGWINSKDIKESTRAVRLHPVESSGEAIKVDIDEDRALLLENRNRKGFDQSLPRSGLLVWKVKNSVIRPGLASNSVNANPDDPGLALIEADGNHELLANANRGDSGDPFPGAAGIKNYDSTTEPTFFNDNIALCNIKKKGEDIVLDILLKPNCSD